MGRAYEIQIEVENQCYLDCCHCSSLTMRHSKANPFRKEELVSLIQLFEDPLHIYFTGGEPLANPDIVPLIELVKNTSPSTNVGIFTCGILKDNTPIDRNLATKLKMSGLHDCYISLYHYDPKKHDLITNQKGSYHSTIQSIRNFMNLEIDVKIHLVINRFNYQDLDEIITNILKLGVSQVRLLRIVRAGAAEVNWEAIGVTYKNQNAAVREIIGNISKYSGSVTIAGFPMEIPCRPTPQSINCQAGTHLLYITSSKQVYPCACTKTNSSFSIGSIDNLIKIRQYLEKQKDYLYNENCLNPIHCGNIDNCD